MSLQQFQAKICYTAAGMLIVENKVLLVKHKKLGTWLNPGGHVEADELPHKTAEREFFEETGVRVKAINMTDLDSSDESEYVPNPIATNLHWISKENYWARRQAKAISDIQWMKGCEQHVSFLFLMQPIGDLTIRSNPEETLGIDWFNEAEASGLEMFENVRQEVRYGFFLMKNLSEKFL